MRGCLYPMLVVMIWSNFDTVRAQQKQKKEEDKSTVNLRLLPIGARRTAVFTKSKKAYKIRIDNPEGGSIEQIIPAGVPIEVKGKEHEYVPLGLFIKNRNRKTGEMLSRMSVGLNSLSPPCRISQRDTVVFYKRKLVSSVDGGAEFKLVPYAKSGLPPETDDVLVAIVKNVRSKEGWAKPMVRSINVEAEVFPAGACLFFNASPFSVDFAALGVSKMTIKPYQHVYIKGLKVDAYGATPYRAVMNMGQKKENLADGALRQNGTSRHYLVSFVDPRKGVVRRGDLVSISEKTPVQQEPVE